MTDGKVARWQQEYGYKVVKMEYVKVSLDDHPCWEQCEFCEDYICNIHELHAHDCDCEDMEWWADHDMYPYVTTVKEYREKMNEEADVN